jgi:copper chaperone
MTVAETVTVQVDGMTCTGCEQRIGNALRRVDGVREVAADYTSGRVQVRFDPETTGPATVIDRITLAGYTVRSDGGRNEVGLR